MFEELKHGLEQLCDEAERLVALRRTEVEVSETAGAPGSVSGPASGDRRRKPAAKQRSRGNPAS